MWWSIFSDRESENTQKNPHWRKAIHVQCVSEGVFTERAGHLKTYKTVHTGEKPYTCTLCHTEFAQSGARKTHERTHNKEKLCKCNVCHKAFASPDELQTHTRTHTGEKPYIAYAIYVKEHLHIDGLLKGTKEFILEISLQQEMLKVNLVKALC